MPRPKRFYPLSDKPNAKGVWEIVWSERDPAGGKQRSRHHPTGETERAAAELYRANWLLALEEANREQDASAPGPTPAVVPTVAQVMTSYRDHLPADAYVNRESWVASTHYVQHSDLGPTLVTELTPLAIAAYGKRRAAGLIGYVDADGERRGFQKGGKASFRNDMLCLNAAMRFCVKNRIFAPAFTLQNLQPVDLPPAPKAREHYLTVEQAMTLLAAAKARSPNGFDPLYIFILICLDTATRCEALEELTWDRLKLWRNEDGTWGGKANFVVPGRPETRKRRGENDLSPKTALVLAELRAARKPFAKTLVVESETTINYRFRRLCKAVLGKEEGPHILRHSWATWAVSSGQVSIIEVAAVLHDTPQTVTHHYGHLLPEKRLKAVNLVASLRDDVVLETQQSTLAAEAL
jgi:integrase